MRLRAYLDAAGHMADIDGPLFRPLKHNGKRQEERRAHGPDAIDRVVRKYAGDLELDRGYSAHSMRATFITTALENGAQLEAESKVLLDRLEKARGRMLVPPEWCFKRARRKHRAGHYEHDYDAKNRLNGDRVSLTAGPP